MDSIKNLLLPSKLSRVLSFSEYPLGSESKAPSSMKLAEAGFERLPQIFSNQCDSDEVYCRMCGLKFSGWSNENPWVVHRTLRPNCLFLNTPPTAATQSVNSHGLVGLQTGNTHAKEVKTNTDKNALNNLRRQLFPMYDTLALKIEEGFPEIQHPFVPKRGNFLMLFESHRLLTFPNCLSTEAATYAKAGFVYDGDFNRAVCVFCNIDIQFIPQEKIFLEYFHKEKSPSCPFIQELDVENISREDECRIREKERKALFNSDQSRKVNSYMVKHPEYNQFSARLGTFKLWPSLLSDIFPEELMADCGFYFTNFGDCVKCFSCGIGLWNWSKGADPFAQHAKASPSCWYILQKKGQEFIDVSQCVQLTIKVEEIISEPEKAADSSSSTPFSLLSMTPSTSPSPSTASSSSASSPSASPAWTPSLDLDSIKAATACQYTIEQIADAVIKLFVSSNGKYPNEALLLGTLRAADMNQRVICDQQQEIIKSQAELSETKSQLKAKDTVIEATKSELARTQQTLQWQNVELRTELEQQFVGQIQQQNQALHHKDEMLQQQGEVIQNKDIQLELQRREMEDLRRHLRSVLADRRTNDDNGRNDDIPPVNRHMIERQVIEADMINEDEYPVANCKVCLTNTSQILFHPCKHVCCCNVCASILASDKCPICREQIITIEKVYVI